MVFCQNGKDKEDYKQAFVELDSMLKDIKPASFKQAVFISEIALMKKIVENINRVLAEWNPIGVNEDIATDEYKSYIPLILNAINNKQQLMNCLEDILVNKIGIDYDPRNRVHLKNLQEVSDKIMATRQKAKDGF